MRLAILFDSVSIPSAIDIPVPFTDIVLPLRLYALAYIAALLFGWWLIVRLVRRPRLWPGDSAPMTPAQVEAFLTWAVLGVVGGGRLGYVVFYEPAYFLANPLEIVQIWDGGMAFHGGLLGVIVAWLAFCRIHRLPRWQVADALALAAPMGLLLGRLANFINAELWGRPSDAPWAVVFPGAAAQDCTGPAGLVEIAGQVLCARHPSQIYEAALEGLVLLVLLLWLALRRGALKVPGLTAGVFLVGYGSARFVVEFFRQPDAQFFAAHPRGYAVWVSDDVGLSMGQLLSLPMVLVGLGLVILAVRRRPAPA